MSCNRCVSLLIVGFADAIAACSTALGNGLFRNPNAIAISARPKKGGRLSAKALKALNAQRADHGPTLSVPSLCHPAELLPGMSWTGYYPDMSRELDEQGTAIVRVCVGADGRLSGAPSLYRSSGYARLDKAALKWISPGRPICARYCSERHADRLL